MHGAKGRGVHYLVLMLHVWQSLATILYVKDTDQLHLDMDGDESVQEVCLALQQAIENWGKLLIATRGSLKPEKSFFHLMYFVWTQKGGWLYIAHHKDEIAVVLVPMPDGTAAPIIH